ncbi:CsbD family protein [Mycolicibacterium moriokaense]|nr:CsbD family protein [Mycolicibacterium moriokaense]
MSATRKARNEFDRIVGRAKEELGTATGNARLRDEGRTDQMRAGVRQTGQRVKDALRGRRRRY